MQLIDLVGEHKLSGVSRIIKYNDSDYTAFAFTLDGVTYLGEEDPEDGYRSCCKDLIVVDQPTKNSFPEIDVICTHIYDGLETWSAESDVLEIKDKVTEKVILRVGTDNTDDYYPYFVFEYYPENMIINQDR